MAARGEGFVSASDLLADEFFKLRGETDLIESGEFEDLENVLEFGSVSFADGGGGVEFLSSDLEDPVRPVSHDGFETGRGDGFRSVGVR